MNLEFRIWDGQKFLNGRDKPYEYTVEAYPFENLQARRSFYGEGDGVIKGAKITQFTGALDKNQKQIFEGDIVLFDNPDPYDGQDQLTKIVGYNSRVMGFRLYNFTHEVDKYGGQVFFPEEVEVIGNIFEGAIKDGVDYGLYLKTK